MQQHAHRGVIRLVSLFGIAVVATVGVVFATRFARATAGSVTGVVSFNGAPVTTSQVSVTLQDYYGTYYGTASSLTAGRFTFSAVPVGSNYLLRVAVVDATLGAVGMEQSNIVVADGAAVDLGSIALPAATKTVSGTITRANGAPVANVTIHASKGTITLTTLTDAAGVYTVKVNGGMWSVGPFPNYNPSGENADWYITTSVGFEYQYFNFVDDQTVELRTANFTVGTASATITGTVKFPDGTPAARAGLP